MVQQVRCSVILRVFVLITRYLKREMIVLSMCGQKSVLVVWQGYLFLSSTFFLSLVGLGNHQSIVEIFHSVNQRVTHSRNAISATMRQRRACIRLETVSDSFLDFIWVSVLVSLGFSMLRWISSAYPPAERRYMVESVTDSIVQDEPRVLKRALLRKRQVSSNKPTFSARKDARKNLANRAISHISNTNMESLLRTSRWTIRTSAIPSFIQRTKVNTNYSKFSINSTW